MSNADARRPVSWGEIIGFSLLALVIVALVQSNRGVGSVGIIPAGTPLPALMAQGWLNVGGPPYEGRLSSESLSGKILVVDCWATWCPPCRKAMPELAALYAKYRPLGVEFLGLTSEGTEALATIEGYVSGVKGFNWPVGYGAMPMQDMLGIGVLPTVIVFGQDGRSLWSSTSLQGIESVLDGALARAALE